MLARPHLQLARFNFLALDHSLLQLERLLRGQLSGRAGVDEFVQSLCVFRRKTFTQLGQLGLRRGIGHGGSVGAPLLRL